jgi:hypothetical protein
MEEFRQKGHMGVEKRCVARGGKISFSAGGGINNNFSDRNIDPCFFLDTSALRSYLDPSVMPFHFRIS